MAYRLIGEAAMVVHFLILVFMAVGGFLAWRWPRLIWAHLAVAAWGLVSVVTGVECPLTALEDWGRRNAGERGLRPTGGFIDHYIEGVVYPQEYTGLVAPRGADPPCSSPGSDTCGDAAGAPRAHRSRLSTSRSPAVALCNPVFRWRND